MSGSNYRRFLSECIVSVPGKQPGLGEDDLYGLYLSWCVLNAEEPGSATALSAAAAQEGHTQQDIGWRREWRELSMTGPAAVDYILASQPSLI
ncbi:hypothetical protein [Arthrobacter sp. B1I2]|uniref:hypothetical protein n=1 Tax=Arthrobacter sp. B1I2 TaxID=3042263 RepID=UPI0027890122|nr:hypothetical protein [Arthrobacter sp. B1I2]MDQ0731150.1 hypothetical protein [Arthrobacter sp. B1I2]